MLRILDNLLSPS
ncbi:hypothetical protein F383_12556 [Gossypium arboreum]|uniref:Uncharacterized protein n=1 Tax=Gossypium arboreum TaxID=29729 RepID=A0A0B0NDV0_GOSAR|nr:hypothetical protein F383_12556 [Gossypium arboreum]